MHSGYCGNTHIANHWHRDILGFDDGLRWGYIAEERVTLSLKFLPLLFIAGRFPGCPLALLANHGVLVVCVGGSLTALGTE